MLMHAKLLALNSCAMHGIVNVNELPNSSLNVESIGIVGAGEADCSRGAEGKGTRQGS